MACGHASANPAASPLESAAKNRSAVAASLRQNHRSPSTIHNPGRTDSLRRRAFLAPLACSLDALGALSAGRCDTLCLIVGIEREGAMAHAQRFLALVNDAKKRVKESNVADVKRRLDAGEKLVLIDVREESEWARGHLPGAIHLGKGVIERDIEQRLPDAGTKVVLYCGGGFRSALAADNLQKMGYTNVESMDGGWKGWLEAGFPTQKD